MKILILGASGMLGHEAFRVLGGSPGLQVHGTARSESIRRFFSSEAQDRLITGVDVLDQDALVTILEKIRPEVVLNCVGLVKQLENANDPLATVPLNSLFPHRLARICRLIQSRVIHISTDCVFRGDKGLYRESDPPDATDLYGRSKLLGELDSENCITLRTSIIGRELQSHHGLVDWFLRAAPPVKGYAEAKFSGLTTHELARVIEKHVLPNAALQGLYHVSAEPISKYDLLKLLNDIYDRRLIINRDDRVILDRSLDSTRFRTATGYIPPGWPTMIGMMRNLEVDK
jgi:dTDP-4-dehydrorhamnose reductase